MIERLEYSVRFPPNDRYPLGQSFERDLTFGGGMTAIVGPNEIGKTLNLELIEFLLFGTSALRGKAEDYKGLRASGVFTIRGVRYWIERSARHARLRTDEVLATGSKPVNQRILQLLGYGLDVFRVANAANQGDAERLADMKPAERKAMVDKLIGADQIEAIARWCGEEALGVSREIAGLEQGLVAPVQPEQPTGYRPAVELSELVLQLRDAADARTRAEAFLANRPEVHDLRACPTDVPLATLEKADQILGLRTYDFDLAAAEAAARVLDLWEERVAFVRRYFPQPTLTREQAQAEYTAQGLIRDLKRLKQTPEIVCPCGKPFTTADAEIARIAAELTELDRPDPGFDLDTELAALTRWTPGNPVATEWERLKGIPPAHELLHDPREAKGAVHVSEVAKAISDMGLTGRSRADVQRLAADLRAWHQEAVAAEATSQRREAWDIQANSVRETLEAATKIAAPGRLAEVQNLLTAVQVYEAQKATYDVMLVAYDERAARVVQLRSELESWKNGKAAMNDLREDTKTYLVPALSRVASYLLDQMTGGARTRIVVDEDFEIEVDGQPLATLSGSGKVCANLALRFGLGRILTNGVFPVFLGDEMDASMDDERARHLHTALCALEGKLAQIIIITHKHIAATRVLRLES